ncbi:MAG: YgeY family selenium metabolism-linked hydrolase [Theionarchaea archaeon]|nr:YgeY family selenium metabolism-linked hydrolase [Theionarchaea archaeon]MBU7000317.1 YgeY family selenium metabolism-linked hydrolase [Theionarchaea archaeon]MBU7020758.1 YgeY family selenium metabolism-linked hydrolase [Theionarchaea archaeon]MBU7034893.1 YgeY family selenium metabolism-linked hydrolase [Theionarchaea archaeon]MBU7040110.1 YgeY family selenium metabolism-linked hydrolase [Theionarchaea archaeon]
MNVTTITQELVRTPSLSGEEREVAQKVRDMVQDAGVDSASIDAYGNVLALIKGSGDGCLLLEGHMDHVPPGTPRLWEHPPYCGKVIDANVYGRGSVDMKGGIASMISSIPDIARKERPVTVLLAFVVHEETVEGAAVHKVLEELNFCPDLVVLGEPTGLDLAVGHRGRSLIRMELWGRTAHASMPHRGINALERAAECLQKIESLKPLLPNHPQLRKATITPISVECSPRGLPQLPDYCELIFDRRLVLNEKESDITAPLQKIITEMIDSLKIRDGAVSILEETRTCWTGNVLEVKDFFPAWITPEKHSIEVKKALPDTTRTLIWDFSTDGVYTSSVAGILTVGFGPGDWRMAHQPNEAVPIKQLEKAREGYVRIAESYSH